ncbi:MAG: 2-hydroxymuconate tautomerase [Hyphomicrobiaceae bacterium]
MTRGGAGGRRRLCRRSSQKRGSNMPVIHVEMFTGRTTEQKRALVKELTEAFVRTCGGKPEQIHIVISDVDTGNWGFAGELVSDRLAAAAKKG